MVANMRILFVNMYIFEVEICQISGSGVYGRGEDGGEVRATNTHPTYPPKKNTQVWRRLTTAHHTHTYSTHPLFERDCETSTLGSLQYFLRACWSVRFPSQTYIRSLSCSLLLLLVVVAIATTLDELRHASSLRCRVSLPLKKI